MKKVLSLIVTAVLLLQMGLCVYAQGNADVVLSVSNVEADAGDTVEVTLALDTNPGISGMTLNISYPETMTLTDVEVGTALNGLEMASYTIKNPLVVTWYATADVDSSTGELLTLTFNVAEDAVPAENDAITVVCEEVVNGDLTVLDFDAIGGAVAITPAPVPTVAVSVSDVEANSGETVDAVVALKTNPGISGMTLNISYPETMTLTNVEAGSALNGLEMAPYTLKNPLVVTWYATANVDSSIGDLLSLTFEVAEGAVPATGDAITVVCEEVVDGDLNTLNFAEVEGGTVTINHIHNYTSEVTKSATCLETGVTTYTCDACGDTYTETIPAVDHTWGETTVTVEATCTTPGKMSATCDVCGAESEEIVIDPLGHTWDEGTVTVEATCSIEGEKVYTCSACGETREEVIAKVAHTYGSASTTPATCLENGSKTYTCTACGGTYTETIPAAGSHTWGEWKVVEEATGEAEKRVCTVCGAEETRDIAQLDDDKWDYIIDSIRYYAMNKTNFTYIVTTSANEGGEIEGPSYVKYGKDAVYVITPDDDYKVVSVKVNGVEIGAVEKVTLENVRANTRIQIEFAEIGEEAVAVINEESIEEGLANPFVDVSEANAYCEAIQYVYENGLMNGTGGDKFSPAVSTERAMIVTILWRLEGEPVVGASETFSDVEADTWYTSAVAWACANGIVNGYGDGTFGPNDAITHEQLAAILYRYAEYRSFDVSAEEALPDEMSVSGWAVEAITWAKAAGLLDKVVLYGYVPANQALRCEVADVLMRLCEFIG